MEQVLVFGCSGQACVTLDILQQSKQYEIAGFIDKADDSDEFEGYPILGTEKDLERIGIASGIVAIGDTWLRSKVVENIRASTPDFQFISAIHPSAQIADSVVIGEGAQIMAGALINPNTVIGTQCIINTNASVDHDNVISDYVSINPGVSIGGKVKIGAFSAIGIGTSVIHDIVIGEHSIVGAGSVVVRDVPSLVVAYGNPCRVAHERKVGEKYL